MSVFSIDDFAADCKRAMVGAEDPHAAASAVLRSAIAAHEPAELIRALEAQIPDGADIGEMVFHTSPELTLLYGRVPARFRSGIHNHTVFACIGQLRGAEKNVLYRRSEAGGLETVDERTVLAGDTIDLPADAIHHIENPTDETACALHLYGGDFQALMDQRSIWTTAGHEEVAFSFEVLLRESALAMKKDGNQAGLDALMDAVPKARSMIEAL